VHVTATLGLFSFTEVRAHARLHPSRYLIAPAALLVATIAACLVLPSHAMSLPLLGFFAWQLWHYQKQNLGLASLAAASARLPALEQRRAALHRCLRRRRRARIVARPSTLQLVSWRPGHDRLRSPCLGEVVLARVLRQP